MLKRMPKLHYGSRGGVYYKRKGRKVYVNRFGNSENEIKVEYENFLSNMKAMLGENLTEENTPIIDYWIQNKNFFKDYENVLKVLIPLGIIDFFEMWEKNKTYTNNYYKEVLMYLQMCILFFIQTELDPVKKTRYLTCNKNHTNKIAEENCPVCNNENKKVWPPPFVN